MLHLTIAEASRMIRHKELSPVELTESLWGRIESVEPNVQAWVTLLQEQSLLAAKQAEKEIAAGNWRGPLHGVPFGAKDLYYTAGIRTSAGSKVNENFIPSRDATVLAKLKQAGAILLGKTTTTEYAFFGGAPATRNPWNLEHTPGGSSSGSAAALAASMAMFTLGTQTAGSLSRPAAYNGLTTLKATYGRVSRAGIIPGSWSLDHPGAFTLTVEDAAFVLGVIAGHDPDDPATISAPVPDYAANVAMEMSGMVLGIPDRYFFEEIDEEMGKAFDAAIRCFEDLGARIVPVTLPKNLTEANLAHTIVMRAEAAAYHQDFYQKSKEQYNPQLREMLEIGQMTPAVDYLRAQRIRQLFRDELVHILNEVDAILTPATPSPAPKGLSYTGSPAFNIPFTNAGVPTLTFPMGFTSSTGLPMGIQLASRPMGEERLIGLGYRYQQSTDWHHKKLPW